MVTPIRPDVIKPGEPDPQIVEILRKALGLAENGEIVSIGIAIVVDGSTITNWAGSRDAVSTLGAVALLQSRLAVAIDANSKEN